MALLALDPQSSTPPYEQARSQIAAAIESGGLRPARDLGLAVDTVARAYRELELADLVEAGGRQGTFVAGPATQARQLAREDALAFLRRMRDLGFDCAEAVTIVGHEADRAIEPGWAAQP
jgi:DNA-binding transcriptional regulator YhcF (GntR family)